MGDVVRALSGRNARTQCAARKVVSDAFEVVAVNIDTRDPEKAMQWLKDNVGIDRLTPGRSDP